MKTRLKDQVELIRAINAETRHIAHQVQLLRNWLEENYDDPRVDSPVKREEIVLCPSCREAFPNKVELNVHMHERWHRHPKDWKGDIV